MAMKRWHFLDLLRQICLYCSERPALSFTSGDAFQAITYGELTILSDKLQTLFKKVIPVKLNLYVGVCAKVKQDLIPMIVAIWKMKHACVMLSARTSHVWSRAANSVSWIITDSFDVMDLTRAKCLATFRLASRVYHVFKISEFPSTDQFLSDFDNGDMCFALTTSGTTGEPKVVRVPWVTIINNSFELCDKFDVTEFDVIASLSPYTFDPFFVEMLMSFSKGANLFVDFPTKGFHDTNATIQCFSKMEKVDVAFNVPTIDLPTLNVTILQATPSIFKILRSQYWHLCQHLKVIVLGGEIFPNDIFTHEKTPNERCQVYDIYGITEASCWAFITPVLRFPSQNEGSEAKTSLLHGLLPRINNNGELILNCFSRICFVDGDGDNHVGAQIRETGDIVEMCAGVITIIGRKDDIIKRLGHKVNPVTSNEILRTYFRIENYVIVFEPEYQLIGWFVVMKREVNVGEDGCVINPLDMPWRIYVNSLDEIERPDMIIRLNKLPVTDHGKTDVNLLREKLKTWYQARRDVTFKKVWCETLATSHILLHATFRESGGSSFLAMRLVARLDAMGMRVSKELISKLLGDVPYQDIEHFVAQANDDDDNCDHNDDTVMDDINKNAEIKLSVKWTHDMHKCVDAQPQLVLIDGVKHVAVGSHSTKLSMLTCDSGEVRWSIHLDGRILAGIAVSADQGRLYTGSFDRNVYCISSDTGSILWRYCTGAEVKCTPVVSEDGRHVYCASYDKRMYCLSQEDGQVVWSYSTSGSVCATPVVYQDILIIAALDGSCTALCLNSIQPAWSKKFKSPIFSSPCLCDENVYVAEVEGLVHCIDTVLGFERFSVHANCNVFSGLTPFPGKYEGGITFAGHDKKLHIIINILGALTHHLKVKTGQGVASTPAVKDGLIACATTAGEVMLIAIDTPQVRLNICNGTEIFSSPIFVDDYIFVGSRDNHLYCLEMTKIS